MKQATQINSLSPREGYLAKLNSYFSHLKNLIKQKSYFQCGNNFFRCTKIRGPT